MLLLLIIALTTFPSDGYDPRQSSGEVSVKDTEFVYGKENREVPLRIYLPESKEASPVLLFSHGLGGSRDNNQYLGNHWAGRGYVVVVMQHAGSDTPMILSAPPARRNAAMKEAASGKNLQYRIQDVKATLDHLEALNESGKAHAGRFDMDKVGMSGHSFGAVTTQAVSGQTFGPLGQRGTDARIKAAIAFSPSPPAAGNTRTFTQVKIPWLLMTGTKDGSPIGSRTDAKSRRLVFEQLPKSDMFYELVFEGGEHSAFSDFRLTPSDTQRIKQHKVIQAVSSAFWDAYLKQDQDAKAWLVGNGPREILDTADLWQRK